MQTDALYTVAEGLSKALAAADPNQEVVVMMIRDTKRWGIFDHDFLTSFVAYARDGKPEPATARLWNALRSARKPVVLAFARLWLLTVWAPRVSFAPVIEM